MPYCLSRSIVEEIFERINKDKLLSKIDYFKKLYDQKYEWSAAFHKDKLTLRSRTSQRVERINRSIKSKISFHISLNELFLRLLNLSFELTNHDIEDSQLTEISTAIHLFANCPLMLSIQDKVSSYSYNLTLLNLAKVVSWKVIQKDSNFIAYQSQIEYGFLMENMKPNTLNCDCYFSKSMGLPCDHILACLIHMPETKTNKIYVENLIKCFNKRWELSEEKEDEKLLNFIKEFQFAPKKLIKKSKNPKSTADQMEEKK